MAVPTFMFIAFIFSGNMIMNRDRNKINARLLRLYMMNVVWALVYFLCYVSEAVVFGKGIFAGKSIHSMIYSFAGQLIFSHNLNPTLWFQIDLIIITAVFAFVYYAVNERVAFVIVISLGILAVIFQYTGLNVFMFWEINSKAKYTLGRICEMLPFASAGILFVKYDIMNKLEVHRKISVMISLILFLASVLFLRKYRLSEGFQYQGVYLIFSAISLTVIFYLLPLKRLPDFMKLTLKNLSRLTPVTYCMHLLAGRYVRAIFRIKGGFTLAGCVCVYVLCIISGFIISLIPGKLSKYLTGI